MLDQQQAEKQLEKFKVGNWRKLQGQRLERLPSKLCYAGRALLGIQPSGKRRLDFEKLHRAQAAAAADLDAMTPAERGEVFAALFPKLAELIEAAWQLQMRMPYQWSSGWHRKGFRAPNRPEASRRSRGYWLSDLIDRCEGFDQDAVWLAAWAGRISAYYAADTIGILLAAAIDRGDDCGNKVFDILCQSASGQHPIGTMGRHVTRGLLCCSRPEAWDYMEKMLLAAQRQEGLRQAILETADEAHPEAFRRILRLILDENLVRFSSVVRAVDVWFGFGWDSVSTGVVRSAVERVLAYLEDPAVRQDAIAGDDAESVYLALWATAFEDAEQAIAPAATLLEHKSPDHRFAALKLLADLALPEAAAPALRALDDEDFRLVVFTVGQVAASSGDEQGKWDQPEMPVPRDVFERLEKVYQRFPKRKERLKPILWPWCAMVADRRVLAETLVKHLGPREPTRLIPYLSDMGGWARAYVAQRLAQGNRWDAATRATLLALVGDASSGVREEAIKAVARCKVTDAEARDLEKLLARKAGDLRRGVLAILLNQSDAAALASADRLLNSPERLQRLAGIELLRQLVEEHRQVEACRLRAEAYRAAHAPSTKDEETLLCAVLDTGQASLTLENGLGLFDPAQRTPTQPVTRRNVAMVTSAAVACLKSLQATIHQHRETIIRVKRWDGQMVDEPLGESWSFPAPNPDTPVEKDRENLPLAEVWNQWWHGRPASQRDKDGFEILRAAVIGEALYNVEARQWRKPGVRECLGGPNIRECLGAPNIQVKYRALLPNVLRWMVRLYAPPGCVDYLLDAVETSLALVPPAELKKRQKKRKPDWFLERPVLWRDYDSPYMVWLGVAKEHHYLCPDAWTDAQKARFWSLLRWVDEPVLGAQEGQSGAGERIDIPRKRPAIVYALEAMELGAATEADVLDTLIGPREDLEEHHYYYAGQFDDLREGTRRKPPKWLVDHPVAGTLVQRVRDRVLEVELARGDTPTVASAAALCISSIWGIDNLLAILQALGRGTLVRGERFGSLEKNVVFSHLVRVSYPREDETPEEFVEKVRAAGLPRDRQLALAFFAPQWARFVERSVGYDGLEEAVWWLHAHTKDEHWAVEGEVREAWQAQISQRTPLSGEDLIGGAVDVAWFHRVCQRLGKAGWAELDEYAKYASGGSGHKRAQLFADAMLGRVKKADLVKQIREKRSQDAVRALGLLPLAKGSAGEKDLFDRYRILQEFLRTSRQFGAQKRESERRAATIGQENLARTAGYRDPIRLQWAMEARAAADVADGGLAASAGGVCVRLAITPAADIELAVEKNGKPLKAIPPAVKKNPKVAELLERRTELKRQVSRVRPALEQMMCRGTTFTGAELREMMSHPLVGPMLGKLVLLGEGIAGYPIHAGKALQDFAGRAEPVKQGEELRLAHGLDLLAGGQWPEWQRDCFARELVQPFKQVFREVYPLTETEKQERTISRRYAGHQIQPRQALALLGSRGWVSAPDEGVRKTFHEEDLCAWLEFQETYYTPAEVEGLTIEGVRFTRRGQWKPLDLAQIPPRLFSEIMRDVDLVVSVAHRGGVDPEASASTIEMRSALLRETLQVLGVDNVRIQGNRALIDGRLGNYSVHLGSAVAHRMPGGALVLVPVHAQHRGRLFLPFADDDPKTAEVLSKVLLLARDEEIRDPSILDQLR